MQKNKLHAAINIIGMAVAFTCSIFLLIFTYHQFTFDKFHTNAVFIRLQALVLLRIKIAGIVFL